MSRNCRVMLVYYPVQVCILGITHVVMEYMHLDATLA